ncbi:MAG: SDR family NAD(P)-dependent oxidoreductase [Nitrospinae bacterium]|nr:SDR family NAD(P)-dependent oxidoreductase [Nitrospinota bacterium]
MKNESLRGPVLVTGCSSGIGYAAAHALRDRGYRLFATARKQADVDRLIAEGFESLRLDLADEASVNEAVGRFLDATGGAMHGLFHNGGFGQTGAVEDLPRRAFEEQFAANVFGAAQLTGLLLPAMRRNGHGRIVVNSSVLGLVAMPMRGAYNASKFALEGLFDTLRLELRGSGVQVSIIEPGPIVSRFRENSLARFEAFVDEASSPHAPTYRTMRERLAKPGPTSRFTLGPETVVAALIDALESDRPKSHYHVTTPTKLFGALRGLLPTRLMDWILTRPVVSG